MNDVTAQASARMERSQAVVASGSPARCAATRSWVVANCPPVRSRFGGFWVPEAFLDSLSRHIRQLEMRADIGFSFLRQRTDAVDDDLLGRTFDKRSRPCAACLAEIV
jgi:hypothetical protein